ncbi:MAG: response regulator transcription factor [Dehalococcoidia bacterium]
METRPSHYRAKYRHDLSPKQEQVLRLIAAGHTNAEIAEELGLTLDGAKWHVREILSKLQVDSREDAVLWWKAHQRAGARTVRALTGMFGGGLGWKVATGAACGGAVLVAAWAFLGSTLPGDDDPPACRMENLRASTSTSTDGIALSMGLRDSDWYEGLLRVLRVSDRHVDSPCVFAMEVSTTLVKLGPIPNAPANLDPVPLVPLGVAEATDNPGYTRVEVMLRKSTPTEVLRAELEGCGQEAGFDNLGIEFGFPAHRIGDPPVSGASIWAAVPRTICLGGPQSEFGLRVETP